jgi:hypothetical protein
LVEKETAIEKRKIKRFKAPKNAYTSVENDSANLGRIINISKDGFAFSYVGKKERITGWHKVEIFLSSEYFCIEGVPFNVISDFYLDTKTPNNPILMKQCGGEFGELTSYQLSQLDHFIAHYIIG